MACEIKAIMPDVPMVIGGPHVTAALEDVMKHLEFDFAVYGEGEETLTDLLDTLAEDGDLSLVKVSAYRKDSIPVIIPATTGTVILALLPLFPGWSALLQALVLDVQDAGACLLFDYDDEVLNISRSDDAGSSDGMAR